MHGTAAQRWALAAGRLASAGLHWHQRAPTLALAMSMHTSINQATPRPNPPAPMITIFWGAIGPCDPEKSIARDSQKNGVCATPGVHLHLAYTWCNNQLALRYSLAPMRLTWTAVCAVVAVVVRYVLTQCVSE